MMQEKWQSKLASQERCESLKYSFGGWHTIIPYLERIDQVKIQGLDHWSYETGVPRAAKTRYKLHELYYKYFLSDWDSGRINSLDVISNRVTTYTVEGMGQVQVGVNTRMGFIVAGEYRTWLVTKSRDSDELLKAPRTAPLVQHEGFALTAFGDSHLVYTGGWLDRRHRMKTTLFYNFEADEWKQGPHLKQERIYHGSCSLGDFTYVIAGEANPGMSNSIERLNAKESIPETRLIDRTHQWELLEVSGATLEPGMGAMACQLNEKELLIMGGHQGTNKRRAFALHHESLELRLLSDCLSFESNVFLNQSIKLSNNKVAARLYNCDEKQFQINFYTPREPHTIQIVKDLGK